jgi:hypothetical protein
VSKDTSGVNLSTGAVVVAKELDFNGTGSVNGATFSAPISGTVVNGNAKGTFYGPTAQEIGGTFSSSAGGVEYNGAFGGN